MALVLFTCQATGPFIAFEETVKQIFKVIGRPWKEEGAFAVDELPEILARLDEAERSEKDQLAREKAEQERLFREGTHEERIKMLDQEEEDRKKTPPMYFYQRIVPLQSMIRRAIKHEKPVMWGRP